jgi:DnaJ-class molecular chaperone
MAAVDQRTYYEILNVNKTATKAEIKKSYYALSRVLHPDKCPDNPNAEELFKQVSQAYQVLMDDSKRELYDRYGKDAVSSSSTSNFDLKEMLGMLFGGGKFENEFGEISFAAVMSAQPTTQSAEEDAKLKEELEKVQADRREKLVYKLLIKLEPFVQNETEGFDAIISADVAEKIDAPGGPALLDHIAYIYIQEAKQHLKRFLGIESFFANLSEKGHYLIEGLDVVR